MQTQQIIFDNRSSEDLQEAAAQSRDIHAAIDILLDDQRKFLQWQ